MKNRREFLSTLASGAAMLAAGSAIPSVASAFDDFPSAGDPELKELAARALSSARDAGCTYADVRFTLTRQEEYGTARAGSWWTNENILHAAVGVRALANGAWGFSASNVWTADEVARLGREAALQAQTNGQWRRRTIELTPPEHVAVGTWSTPIEDDPFAVPLAERLDVLFALVNVVERMYSKYRVRVDPGSSLRVELERQDRTFASTEGAFTSQSLWHINPTCRLEVQDRSGRRRATAFYERLAPRAAGWEVMTDPGLASGIPEAVEQLIPALDTELVDADRYDVVCDAWTTAQIVGHTLGMASELDRILGYEANAGGTSWLPRPDDPQHGYPVAPNLLNVTADRTRVGGSATVRWDDEGVAATRYPLIRNGALVDAHCTREFGVNSKGAAASTHAGVVPLCYTPNLEMAPAKADTTMDDLVAGLEKGIVILQGDVTLDRQQRNGEINTRLAYEVKNGRRTRYLNRVEALFRAPDLWKGLQAIGGSPSRTYADVIERKGQPEQSRRFTVAAVPARFHNVAITDRMRKM